MSVDESVQNKVFSHLEAMHQGGDTSVLKRQQEIMLMLTKEERTIQDLAEHYKMNYYTIRDNVKELQAIGLVEVSPRKDGKRTLYRATWNMVKKGAEEIRWRSSDNTFHPVSEYMSNFKGASSLAAQRMMNVRTCLVALWVDQAREAEGKTFYGEKYRAMLKKKVTESHDFFENINKVISQAYSSPIWDEADGYKLFNLPVGLDRDEAEKIHNEWFLATLEE